ncbi:MAG: NAD(P)/FAD-dependent oxidoreductase [Lysobacterales bacterium]
MPNVDVVVIGGGLIGCACALGLAKGGASVALLERGQFNQGASGQNAGSLHFQLEHRLLSDIDNQRSELEHYVGLTRIAIDQWRHIDQEVECDTELHMNGGIMVAETTEQVALLKRKSEIEQSQGLAVELLDGDAARTRAPYISRSVLAALFCEVEGHCNPRLLTPAYASAAARHGAQQFVGAEVTAITRRTGRWRIGFTQREDDSTPQTLDAEIVVNAGGVSAQAIAAMANVHLPLFPVALLMNCTEKVEPVVPHLVQHVGRKLSLKQTHSGNLLIGGGWTARLRQDGGNWSTTLPPDLELDAIRGNLRTACDVVPLVKSLRLLRSWTGMTAITADQLPVLGEVNQAPGFYVAAGGSGFTYGPTYAKLLSEQILTGKPSFPLDPYSPARFQGLNAFMGQ